MITKKVMKEVDVVWAEEQKLQLQISLLGVCVKPIEFRKVMNLLLDEWDGSGEIECRDVGPHKCLITFSSPEIRNEAMQSKLLLSVFDEVRPHWDIFWCLSRRVWIEIMSLPICLWCKENISEIGKLWGECPFPPDLLEDNFAYTDEYNDAVVMEGLQPDFERSPTTCGANNLNERNVDDPLLNAMINCELGVVHAINYERMCGGDEFAESMAGMMSGEWKLKFVGDIRFIGIEKGIGRHWKQKVHKRKLRSMKQGTARPHGPIVRPRVSLGAFQTHSEKCPRDRAPSPCNHTSAKSKLHLLLTERPLGVSHGRMVPSGRIKIKAKNRISSFQARSKALARPNSTYMKEEQLKHKTQKFSQ
ncbi:hypothetical protein PIB30_061093 [Stylosanthes scabra]|uniref:DUF4283 domain-containing protein n=1 Tax=Stylosanthes scabra TaxID=79078 RepID=A0ABU6UK97_9FABA|nr:hypothetical protein [Stylosanthes scabra]